MLKAALQLAFILALAFACVRGNRFASNKNAADRDVVLQTKRVADALEKIAGRE